MKSRKELLTDAKRLLRKDWVKGNWVIVRDGEGTMTSSWTPHMGMKKLKALLGSHPNPPDCAVCAQGAVYLACALDGDTDNKRAKSIIRSLDRQTTVASDYGLPSVMHLNDSYESDIDKLEAVFDKTLARMKDK